MLRSIFLFIVTTAFISTLLLAIACSEPEPQIVEVEVQSTVEVTRQVPVTVEVAREKIVERAVPVTVLVEREIYATIEVPVLVDREVEVTREVPVTREVVATVLIPQTVEVEVTREVDIEIPVTVEVEATREVPSTVVVPQTVEVERVVEATREVSGTVEVVKEVETVVTREIEVEVLTDIAMIGFERGRNTLDTNGDNSINTVEICELFGDEELSALALYWMVVIRHNWSLDQDEDAQELHQFTRDWTNREMCDFFNG